MRASTATPACQILRHEVAFVCRHDDTPGGKRLTGLCAPLDEKALGQFCLGDFSNQGRESSRRPFWTAGRLIRKFLKCDEDRVAMQRVVESSASSNREFNAYLVVLMATCR
jgi:hypothetical protein